MQGDSSAEALRIDSLAELSIGPGDGGCHPGGRSTISRRPSVWAPSYSFPNFLCLYLTLNTIRSGRGLIDRGGNPVLKRSCSVSSEVVELLTGLLLEPWALSEDWWSPFMRCGLGKPPQQDTELMAPVTHLAA